MLPVKLDTSKKLNNVIPAPLSFLYSPLSSLFYLDDGERCSQSVMSRGTCISNDESNQKASSTSMCAHVREQWGAKSVREEQERERGT